MKRPPAILVLLGPVFLGSATGAFAQQQQQQAAPVKMECRELSISGNVVFPNETIDHGMACHTVAVKPTAAAQAAAPAVTSQPAQQQPAAAGPAATLAAPVDLASMRINSGSTIFIAPMDGFENYMAAAMRKKDVPLMPITDESRANYILRGNGEEIEKTGGWVKVASLGQVHSDAAANIQLIDRRTGAIVFAYTVSKKNTLHGQQSAAEDCAKHLKDAIDK